MSLWHQTAPGHAFRFPGGACPRCQSDLLLQGEVTVAPHPVLGCKVYLSGTVVCVGCGTTAVLPTTGLVLPQLPDAVDLGDQPLASRMRSTRPRDGLQKLAPPPLDSAMTDEPAEPDVATVIAEYYAEDQIWGAGATRSQPPSPALTPHHDGPWLLTHPGQAVWSTYSLNTSTAPDTVAILPSAVGSSAPPISLDTWTSVVIGDPLPDAPKKDIPLQPNLSGFTWEVEWKMQKAYKQGAIVICDGVPCIATKYIPPTWSFQFSDGWVALAMTADAYKWTVLANPWKPTTMYKAGQMVTHQGVVYRAVKLIPGTSVFRVEDGWKIIEDPSAVKPKPIHGPYLGHWGPNNYVAADIVRYEGHYYRASRNIPTSALFTLEDGWELLEVQAPPGKLPTAVHDAEQAFKILEQAFAAGAKEFGEALQALPPASASYEMVSPLATLCSANSWSYQGSLQVHKTYYPNDVVIVDGEYYRCVEEASGLTYPPMSMKWKWLMAVNAQHLAAPPTDADPTISPELSFEEKPHPAPALSYEWEPGSSATSTNTKLLTLCIASGFIYRGPWKTGGIYHAGKVVTISKTAWLSNHVSDCNCSPESITGHWTRLLN